MGSPVRSPTVSASLRNLCARDYGHPGARSPCRLASRYPSQVARHDETTQNPTPSPGKGRPTPKRSESERSRRTPVAAPTTGKEAAKLRRAESVEQRARTRLALQTGDEKNLPLRDRGPTRRFTREFVDVRMSLAEWFVPAAVPLYVLATFWPKTTFGKLAGLAILALTFFVILELLLMTFQLKRALKRKFPNDTIKGARLYAVMRGAQMRRLRAPKPQIKRFASLD